MSNIHYSERDLEALLDGFEIPSQFDFGCSTAGYQVEGGLNGQGDPKNNWYVAEQSGAAELTGPCTRFLEKYESDLDLSGKLGLNAFRMGIEWARLQPAKDPASTAVPPFSDEAALTYARVIDACYERGMFPAVTLHHFTNPLWAGLDFWLDREKVIELFGNYLEFSITTINRMLVERFGRPPIPYYITINEPFMVPMASYFLGIFPTAGQKGLDRALICYENMLLAHVLAYRAVHRIYRERGWAAPTVTVNTWCASIYPMDRLAQDLFLARQNGISRDDLPLWLAENKAEFQGIVAAEPYLSGPQWLKRRVEGFIDAQLTKALGPQPMPALVEAIYDGSQDRLLDAVGFDYYDPFPGNYVDFKLADPVYIREKPWQWNVAPVSLGAFLDSYSRVAGDLPIHILENGMCYRHDGRRAYLREDRAVRQDVLKATLFETIKAMKKGINIGGYYYWSLLDNYEWGSYEPRFGLFGVDYSNGDAKRLATDVVGNNAAGAYSLLVKAFRARDNDALLQAFKTEIYPVFEPEE